MGTTAEQLYEDYNDYRRQTGYVQKLKQQQKYIPSISKKHLPKFEALATWCSEQKVDPRRWLASLFETRRWLFPPKLNQLQSQRHLQRYEKMDVPAFAARIRGEHQRAATESGDTFNRTRDISNGAEMIKRRYLAFGNYERCMAEMEDTTYGYHPKSAVCQGCQVRYQCAAILQSKVSYDIMSVRLGLMSVDEAKMVVARYGRGK